MSKSQLSQSLGAKIDCLDQPSRIPYEILFITFNLEGQYQSLPNPRIKGQYHLSSQYHLHLVICKIIFQVNLQESTFKVGILLGSSSQYYQFD